MDQEGRLERERLTTLAKQLADSQPYDISEVELGHYRRLVPFLRNWDDVAQACRDLAQAMVDQ